MTTEPLGLISYRKVETPITEPVSKFGGQPTWILEPQWPLSRSTGKPMRFLCQIAIDPGLFGDVIGKMAYIFINDPEDEMEDAGDNYAADAGENAVIIQPGHPYVATAALRTGPTLRCRLRGSFTPCEFLVTLNASAEPAYDPALSLNDEGDLSYESGFLLADKIGGSPRFIQGPEFPEGSGWRLLVQFGALQDALPFGGGFAYVFWQLTVLPAKWSGNDKGGSHRFSVDNTPSAPFLNTSEQLGASLPARPDGCAEYAAWSFFAASPNCKNRWRP